MEEKQEAFTGGFGSPQGALFRQKLALDNMRRFCERYKTTAEDLYRSYERKKREEDFVSARNLLLRHEFYLNLQAFTQRVLETFKTLSSDG